MIAEDEAAKQKGRKIGAEKVCSMVGGWRWSPKS